MNHNLDDLIIDESEIETPKPKNLLSKIALIIIVLIVGIVISKLIISDKGDPIESIKDKELEKITDPSQTDPEIAKLAKEDNFEKVDNTLNRDLSPINQGTKDEEDISLDDTNFDSDYGSVSLAQNEPSNTPASQQNNSPQETTPLVTPTPQTIKPRVVQQQPRTQQIHQTPRVQQQRQQRPRQTTPKPVKRVSIVGKYFIQVGSFSKKPSSKYLSAIKQKGYTPFIIKSGNLYKVRVGPYNSFADAKAKLSAVNSALNTQGFVVKYVKGR